jgi:beta-mannosidase
MRFPASRPLRAQRAQELGLNAGASAREDGALELRVASERLAYGVRVHVPGFVPSDDAFSVEPRHERVVQLLPRTPDAIFAGGSVTAVNLQGQLPVPASGDAPRAHAQTLRGSSG